MDIKKIISVGILCGLSLGGSATINREEDATYPVVGYSPVNDYGNNFFPSFLDCLSKNNCAWLPGLIQGIANNTYKLVGNNPTDGQALGAALLASALVIYDAFNAHPEALHTARNALNGRLSLEEKIELRNELDKSGTQILNCYKCFLKKFECALPLPQLQASLR
ncbi:MAG: hypothetical protein LBB05_04345 [Puniceicoccales bacterium]|jgi:hypothetical protein|nr:hypothetical protein [Puniceicoccales bacterium]